MSKEILGIHPRHSDRQRRAEKHQGSYDLSQPAVEGAPQWM